MKFIIIIIVCFCIAVLPACINVVCRQCLLLCVYCQYLYNADVNFPHLTKIALGFVGFHCDFVGRFADGLYDSGRSSGYGSG